jgi:hypothetical protein
MGLNQHQVKLITGPGGDPVSDPNRTDDPEYIVLLVGWVVRASVESVALISSQPPWRESVLTSVNKPADGAHRPIFTTHLTGLKMHFAGPLRPRLMSPRRNQGSTPSQNS